MRRQNLGGGPSLALGLVLIVLSACSAPPPAPPGLTDPFEAQNRRAHEFNRGVDTAIFRPLSRLYGDGPPGPVRESVSNFGGNLSMPQAAVNKFLQGRIEDAVHNTVRFVLNTTIGIGGLFDPAEAMGLSARDTDFGETLHVWGMAEGAYLEVPFVGPSTERDLLGIMVDTIIDPLGFAMPKPERYYAKAVKIGSKLSDRARFSDTVDSILYDSADSYAQTRLLYLQSRRFELGQEASDEDFFDPYESPYGE